MTSGSFGKKGKPLVAACQGLPCFFPRRPQAESVEDEGSVSFCPSPTGWAAVVRTEGTRSGVAGEPGSRCVL